MSEQHERLLRRAYEAFNARDIEEALATMHPVVDWPNAMEGGRVHGHAEVRKYWERQWGSFDSRVQPLRIEQGLSGRMVATVHQLVRDLAGSVVSDETVEHRFSIADGLIERMDILDHWTIRSAGEKDIASVLNLWVVAGSVPSVSDSPEGLARLVAADPRTLLVAEFDGVLVGSLIAAWDGWHTLATALAREEIAIDPGSDRSEVRSQLMAIPGIGAWTSDYIAMRALSDPDAFLPTDLGVKRALAQLGRSTAPKDITDIAEQWRPWRAYALQHLWATYPLRRKL